MDELISRQAAIDALGEQPDSGDLDEWECGCRSQWEWDKEAIENVPSADFVTHEVVNQIKWERDTAISQLKDLGYGLGEKIRTDGDTISRQAAIDAFDLPIFNIKGKENAERVVEYLKAVLQRIKELPSAEPEPHKEERR